MPLHINSCEVEQTFGADAAAQADAVMGDGKYAPGYKRDWWASCSHGFAVRFRRSAVAPAILR